MPTAATPAAPADEATTANGDGFAVKTDDAPKTRRAKRPASGGLSSLPGWASRLTWRQGLACGAACGGLAGAVAGGLLGGLGATLGGGAFVVPAICHGLTLGASWGGVYGALACREAAERALACREAAEQGPHT